jgi:hypothetical protein
VTITVYPPYGSMPTNALYTQYTGMQTDAFGRLRISQPYTLFDSQNRYQADPAFSQSTSTGGTATFVQDRACIDMATTTSSGSAVVLQTRRVFSYQPGKSFLFLATFVMNEPKANLRQRVGLFSVNDGVFFQVNDSTKSFVIRSSTSGSPSDTRTVNQADWNQDRLDGTGPSGLTLDVTKAQILFADLEWLGVGSVRMGFIIGGKFIVCHIFDNANIITSVYMQTACLPIRYEITNTGATSSASTMQKICCSIMSEGGYERVSPTYTISNNTPVAAGASYTPIASIRLNSSYLGAIVIPSAFQFLPIDNGGYEVAFIRNATLTGATWADTRSYGQVDCDRAATSMTYDNNDVVYSIYTTASNQSVTAINQSSGYNWGLQLGVDLAGASGTMTLAARLVDGVGSDVIGSITFWNLTV